MVFKGENLLEMAAEDRSLSGLFMSFQSPVEIPGVTNIDFLNMAYNARRKKLGLPELGPIEVAKTFTVFKPADSGGLVLHSYFYLSHCSSNAYFFPKLDLVYVHSCLCLSSLQFYAYIFPKLDLVNMKTDFLNRNVNEGFSGGEKKRNEILQLAVWLSFVVNLLDYVILIKQNFVLKKMPSACCMQL